MFAKKSKMMKIPTTGDQKNLVLRMAGHPGGAHRPCHSFRKEITAQH